MKIILNGIGCPYSGGRLVLDGILQSAPTNLKIFAILPKGANVKIISINQTNIKAVYLNVKYWAFYLRPILEVAINFIKVFRKYDFVINLSNYGLCLTKNQMVYIHNPYLIDINAPIKFGGGYPNFINRFGLNTYLRNADKIVIQTQHMLDNLEEYSRFFKIPLSKNIVIVSPKPSFQNIALDAHIKKSFDFQFLYPASDFIHKRVDLAIDTFRNIEPNLSNIGLLITTDFERTCNNIHFLGKIDYQQVLLNLSNSDALLFTSERETLGLPLLEALHFEIPAVLPDLPYAKEIYGDAAVYFKEFNTFEVQKAISELYYNYDHYKERAIRRKKHEFSRRKDWKEHWEIFLQ